LKYIYITGDSFCFNRTSPTEHWPLILANNLGYELTGEGFPGCSWWPSRLDLIQYKNQHRTKFNNTDLFVFCHTEQSRMLGDKRTYFGSDESISLKNEIREFYLKHVYNEKVNQWAMLQWFNELNNIVADKNVIHLFCFKDTEIISSELNGTKFKPDLFSLSRRLGIKSRKNWVNCDSSPNHFSPYENMLLASFLTKFIQNNSLHECANNYFQIKL